MNMLLKRCTKCKSEKPLDCFHKASSAKDGLFFVCKVCRSAYSKVYHSLPRTKELMKKSHKKWQERNPSFRRIKKSYNLFNFYGFKIEHYDNMVKKQNNRCGICQKHQLEFKKRLCIDHNHKTNKVRGLLCANCNSALGFAKDSPEILKSAILYLEEHNNLELKPKGR